MEEKTYTTREAAKLVGVSHQTLLTWIEKRRMPSPKLVAVGKNSMHVWTKAEIERARKLKGTLPPGPKRKAKR